MNATAPIASPTFPALLARLLREDPGRPLVTYYDDATGERTELSVVTYANWVSKNANLLLEELDLEPGDVVLLDLPGHWLVPVFLGAAWSVGVAVTTDPTVPHRVVVCGPDALPAHTAAPGGPQVLACSLHPFATRFPTALPPGVVDHGSAWPGQSDVLVAPEPVGPDDPAWAGPDGSRSQGELLASARAQPLPGTGRLLTDHHPLEPGHLVADLLSPLLQGGSVVLVRHADPASWDRRAEQERADVVRRADRAD
ncbi:TIGR03089 family protein [Nocardioides aurantiacus]|uniref:TIGR03089 family protein n=1 Tax=Nocardioides aurantiacus TaxID=86796 RepID=UPI001FE9DB16|nr:TIGR03089 family protein [Nocardioides aurantiacus]